MSFSCVFLTLVMWCLFGETQSEIVFNEVPQSRAVLLGQDLTLNCVAADIPGSRPLTYMWEFEDQPTYVSLPRSSVFVNNSLFVPRIQEGDLGRYRCIVQVTGQPASTAESHEVTIVKAYIESFFMHPLKEFVLEGSNASLECVTGPSAPPPIVYWQHNGVRFSGGRQAFATFGNIKEGGAAQIFSRLEFVVTDATTGYYECVAENPLSGETVRSITATVGVIKVERPPLLIVSPEDGLAPVSQPFQINCTASGWPAPRITWYQDDLLVTNSTRRYMVPNGSLFFQEFLLADQGSYICNATNELGSTGSNAVTVTAAYINLTFVDVPDSTTALAGQRETLTCRPPASVPPAKVIWYKDSSPLELRSGEFAVTVADNGDLQFASVQLTDNGRYYCVAVNDYAVPSTRTSPVAYLEVRGRPILLQPPLPQKIVKGELLTVICRISGRPFPTLFWFRDQTELVEDGRVSFREQGQVLLISNVNKADEGDYRCMATSSLGSAESVPVFIDVIVPPEILQSVRDVTAPEGNMTLMECRAYGEPTPRITWYKDGIEIMIGSHYSQVAEGLQINGVTKMDEGVYRCVARNDGGNKTSEAKLTIAVGASILFWPGDQIVTEGDPLNLYCDIQGVPRPQIVWTYNGKAQFKAGVTFARNGQTLVIAKTNSTHSGNYSCAASNMIRTERKTLNLLVRVKPTVTDIEGDLVINQGNDLDLLCKVTGIPLPAVEWYFNGALIQPELDSRVTTPTSYSLRVKYMSASDSGEYRCVATSPVGSALRSVTVYIRETPLPPVLMDARAVSTSSVNLSWVPVRQDPKNIVTAFAVQYKLASALDYDTYRQDISPDVWSVEVEGLRPFSDYVFRVASVNEVGIGAFSRILGARTLETAPSAPRGLRLSSSNATSVVLQWEVPAWPNGEIRYYQVHYRKKFENQEYTTVTVNNPTLPLQYFVIAPLDPFTTYEFRVRAATIEDGTEQWGDFSFTTEVTTSGAVPSSAPSNLRVTVLGPYSADVMWQEIPSDAANAPLGGYKILYKRTSSSEPESAASVPAGTRRANITNLLPWRQYSLKVVAYNNVGNGPPSEEKIFRTDPTGPSGAPQDVTLNVLNATAVSIAWKSLPPEEENSQINGYTVQYIETENGNTHSNYIGNPRKLATTLGGLHPYTLYTIQVQAFTTQVRDGFGPLSPPQMIRTAQGTPGPVENLTVSAMPYAVQLKWDEPIEANGVIMAYIVTYLLAGNTADLNMENSVGHGKGDGIPRRRRSPNGGEVRTTSRNVAVDGLLSATAYAFSVVAETGGGRGHVPKTVTVTTLTGTVGTTMTVVLSTSPLATSSTTMATTTTTQGSTDEPSSFVEENLALIVGLSVGGGMLLIMIIIILVFCCCRYRRDNAKTVYYRKGKNVVPPAAFTRESIAALELRSPNTSTMSNVSSTMYNSDENPPPDYDSGQYSGSPSSGSDRQVPSGRATNGHLAPGHRKHITNGTANGTNGIMKNGILRHPAYSSDNEVHLANIPTSVIGTRFGSSRSLGIDNPSYLQEGATAHPDYSMLGTYPGHLQPYRSSRDLNADLNISKRRINRMKSASAAAIAAQRNAESSVFDDTNVLIRNTDSVVVYDERTAL